VQYRVVKEKSKWQRWFGPLLALIACLIAGGLGLLWGASAAQSQIQENVALKERVDELTVMNTGLRGRLTDSELIIDTQKYTAIALRDELTQLHKDKAGLETELGFFRKIMVPDGGEHGLQVERFSVTPKGGSQFVIKATLIHVSERRRVVSGTVKIAVEGTQGGSPVTLSTGALEGSPEKLTFRFRYFQEIEQTVVLPQDFAATAIKLEMIGNNSAPVEAQFVWAAE
jgi:hypothetical protein